MSKYLHCICVCIIALLIYKCNSLLAVNIIYHNINEKPLNDVIHNNTPPINPKYTDYILNSIVLYFILRWFKNDINVIIKYGYILIIIQLLKIIAYTVTSVPPILRKTCADRTINNKNIILSGYNTKSVCKDYMFSGHMSNFVIITTLTYLYSPYNIEKYILLIFALINAYIIITSRIHYSNDVFIGSIISSLLTLIMAKIEVK